jgi:hypothetical protein
MATLYKYQAGDVLVQFVDEEDQYQPDQIKNHWRETYPALANCTTDISDTPVETEVDGQKYEIDRTVEFVKRVGTKG